MFEIHDLLGIENDKVIFLIPCPICKNRYNYNVNILIVYPKNLNVVKVYCPYKHSFLVKIKKVINNNRLLVEVKEEIHGGDEG
jgi:hypothetical protein